MAVNKKIRLLILMILGLWLGSCRRNIMSPSEFENELYKNIFNAYEVEIIHKENLNSGKEISGAPMSWITLLRASKFDLDMNKIEYVCLGYQIPFFKKKKSSFGILKMHKSFLNTCPNIYSDDDVSVNFISMLRFNFASNLLELDLHVGKKGLRKNIQIPILNNKGKKDNGIYFVGYDKIKKTNLFRVDKIKKKIENFNFANKCFSIDKKCTILKKNTCDECRYGYFEVAGGSCVQGGNRYCRPVNCGEKNMPACVRTKKINKEDVCYSKSTAGFCKEGLVTQCNPDGLLICL